MYNGEPNPQGVQVGTYDPQGAPQPFSNQPVYQYQGQQPVYQPQMGYQQPMYQQPMPIYQDNNMYMGGMQMPMVQFVQDPMALLATAKKASVKQKFEFFEVITGCESANQYYVSCEDNEGNKRYLFKAKENSSWCCRNCCSGASREFDLDMKRVQYTSQGQEQKINFAKFERPFK